MTETIRQFHAARASQGCLLMIAAIQRLSTDIRECSVLRLKGARYGCGRFTRRIESGVVDLQLYRSIFMVPEPIAEQAAYL